jgi:hypothetical protein
MIENVYNAFHTSVKVNALTDWDDATASFELEKGDVEVLISSSSADLKLRKDD